MSDLPDTNPKTRFGVAKPGISAIPPVAILHLGQAMANGEAKYGLFNWRQHQVSSSVYYNAAARHLMAWWEGEQVASDSGVHHLGHVMACCAILIDAETCGMLNDDRSEIGTAFQDIIDRMTKPMEPVGVPVEDEPVPVYGSAPEADWVIDLGLTEDEQRTLEALLDEQAEALGRPVADLGGDFVHEIVTTRQVSPYVTEQNVVSPSVLPEVKPGITEGGLDLLIRNYMRGDVNNFRLANLAHLKTHLGVTWISHMNQAQRTRLAFYLDCAMAEVPWTVRDCDTYLDAKIGGEQ